MTNGVVPMAVLDASALLAFVYDEPGVHRVRPVIARGAAISGINWAEALSDLSERGESAEIAAPRVAQAVSKVGTLVILPFDEVQAIEVARLSMRTKSLGLSLADRACLALGRLRRLPVLTTDRAWRSLHISVTIVVIR